jgi:PleD family two-component response regulator
MSAAAVRILVVGTSTASTESILKGLARSGWESHAVKTVREADTVLRTIRFQLTLATEKLPDGTGYELASLVAQQTGNLFVSVPLSETCLWLPAIENGVRSLIESADAEGGGGKNFADMRQSQYGAGERTWTTERFVL